LTLLHGQVCIALYARRARVLLSILCSPGHVVEEERIALPLGEATFVSQVLRIGIADAAVGLHGQIGVRAAATAAESDV
jgi:hypothetical protein